MKNKLYKINSSIESDNIFIYKNENNRICIHLGYDELQFTIKEAKEIIDCLRKCIVE